MIGAGGTKPTQVRFSKLEWLLAEGQTQKSRQKHSPGCLALLNMHAGYFFATTKIWKFILENIECTLDN